MDLSCTLLDPEVRVPILVIFGPQVASLSTDMMDSLWETLSMYPARFLTSTTVKFQNNSFIKIVLSNSTYRMGKKEAM